MTFRDEVLAGLERWRSGGERLSLSDRALTHSDLQHLISANDTHDFVSFNGAVFPDGDIDLSNLVFQEAQPDFSCARFGSGDVDFNGIEFGHQGVDFSHTAFGDGDVSFLVVEFGIGLANFKGCSFGAGDVDFRYAEFGPLGLDFSEADFGSGEFDFDEAEVAGGDVKFSRSRFGPGTVNFSDLKLGRCLVDFDSAVFGDGDFYLGTDFDWGYVRFNKASFGSGDKYFGIELESGSIDFSGTAFGDGDVWFEGSNFGDQVVRFEGARFGDGTSSFNGVRFGDGRLDFGGATFEGLLVDFEDADFGDGDIDFSRAKLGRGEARFEGARFGPGRTSFASTTFGRGKTSFDRVDFGGGDVDFSEATFEQSVSYEGAKFRDGELRLNGTSWPQPLIVSADAIDLSGAVLSEGGRIFASSQIDLSDIVILGPTSIRSRSGAKVTNLDRALLSAELVIGDGVDLSDCSFEQSTGLSYLRPIGRAFQQPTGGRQRLRVDRRRWPWSRRSGGTSDAEVSDLYRQIRTGLEEAGNIPGAHDFYYGEMEARRRDAGYRRPLESILLLTYMLTGGYGLRAWRSFAWLAVVVALCAWGFDLGGFQPAGSIERYSLLETIDFTIRSTTLFFRPGDGQGLTVGERYIQLAARTFGPILLGLGFLGIRNRVKR